MDNIHRSPPIEVNQRPLSAYAHFPFLMLLGRPGSGKSYEMREAEQNDWLGKPTVLVEAKEIGTANLGLYFESILPAKESAQPARIIIDGLDEALMQNPNFVAQLKGWLRRNLTEEGRPKFNLAISCRWADWPVSQVEELASLWPANDAARFILCPLQQSDVVDTLQQRFGQKKDRFWEEMNSRHLRHVACWPQGLVGLMDQFEDSGCRELASYAKVIEDQIVRACRLADSPDDSVRWPQSVPDAEWRRRVAGRLAAAMIFSGKAHLDLTSATSGKFRAFITVTDLSVTDELWGGQRLTVKLSDLNGLVNQSRLMKQLINQRHWVFQSQVHQEWLAADWLASQRLGISQLKQLFGVINNGKWTVFPVLRTVAAWLACFDPDFRKLLLERDPLVLMRMDGASLPEADRKEIVEALLQTTNDLRVIDSSIVQAHLPSLNHASLTAQLTAWLRNDTACDPAKELAIEIAEKTRLNEIAEVLWDLFPKSVGRLQIEIAGALYRLAREGFEDKWRSVLSAEMPIDSHGTILGAAINIMVTSSAKIPVRDILQWIIPERRFDVYGIFDMEARTVHGRLTVADLPALFAKLGENPSTIHDSLSRAKDLNKAAVKLAIQNFEHPEVATALIRYWHECLRQYAHPHYDYNSTWNPEELSLNYSDKRHSLTLALMTHPEFEANTKRKWITLDNYLLLEEDFEWCLDQLISSQTDDEWRFALPIRCYLWKLSLSETSGEKLIIAWKKSAALRDMLCEVKEGETILTALDRERAESQTKNQLAKSVELRKRKNRESKFKQELQQYSENCQKEHKKGNLVWGDVYRILALRQHRQEAISITFEPISKIGGEDTWMVEAAKRYLTQLPLKVTLEDQHGTYGLLALATCLPELEWDGPVRQSISQHWLPLFISHLCDHYLGTIPSEISNENFAQLFPNDFARSFGEVIRKRYLNKGSLSELRSFQTFWQPEMTDELVSVLRDEGLQPEGFFNGLKYLAQANENAATNLAYQWLQKIDTNMSFDIRAILIGAAAVTLNGRLAAEIQEYLNDSNLVARALRTVASRLGFHELRIDFTQWSDGALKNFADACWRAYPMLERSPSHSFGMHEVTSEHSAIEFRDHITTAARSRGLEVLIPNSNHTDSEDKVESRMRYIDWNRHATSQARVGNAWQLLPCSTFFSLASRPLARLARNTDELLSAVIESLQQWEASLATGIWDHLWDIKTRTSRPEERIAIEMRNWLNSKLDIVVEREVELSSENRTDIIVQTIPPDATAPKLTVVIELKKLRKSNAKERRTAMKTQLLDRYLKERAHEGWTHGLYVIAWTPEPDTKDDSDEAIKVASNTLERQARELSRPPFVLKSIVIDARFR